MFDNLNNSVPFLAQADPAAFIQRLQECVDEAKSARAFAERAGIPASSLHGYLNGVEPQRVALIQLANAAGISVSRLAAGTVEPADESPFRGQLDPSIFRTNLAALKQNQGGVSALSTRVGIPPERLEGLLIKGSPTLVEAVALGEVAGSLDQLFYGTISTEGISSGTENSTGGSPAGKVKNGKQSGAVWFDLARQIAEVVETGNSLKLHIQDTDNMAPTIAGGAILIVDLSQAVLREGICLMQTPHGPKVCRIVHQTNGRVLVSYDNPVAKIAAMEYDEGTMKIIGRVVLCISKLHT